MSIGKTVLQVAAVALAVSVALYVVKRARKVAAARKTAGFSADTTGTRENTGVVEPKLSIDVDSGEPVLKPE